MTARVDYQRDGDIAVLRIEHPPVNALSVLVRQGLVEGVARATDDGAKAIVIIGTGRCFSAGADITEFGKPPLDPWLPEVVNTIEASSLPVVAAIHGMALGGGLEVALGAHYRCALAEAKLGLPEVKLGLLPGAGGTQRTPRLIGQVNALNLMTTGKPVTAAKGAEMGLIDRIIDGDLETGALAYARELVAAGAPVRPIRAMELEPVDGSVLDAIADQMTKKTRGQEAPGRIVECVRAAQELSFDEGLKRERDLFMECMASDQSAALRHVFAAERKAAQIADLPPGTEPREVRSVGIIGGGTMGGGIAMCFANVGIPVTLVEVDDAGLERGLGIVKRNYEYSLQRGRFTQDQVDAAFGSISGTTDYADLAEADLIIEAVFEDLELKKTIFAKLDQVAKPGAILATNTSYQDVNVIASSTSRAHDVVGTHFFSPANVMKLLEVVRGDATAPDVLATVMAVGKKIGKVCAVSGVCYGFIGNRMLSGYLREAQLMLLEGATPAFVDGAMEGFGMAMGPLAVSDLAGLDVGYRARASRMKELGITDAPKWPGDLLVEADRLGQKSGAGFYRYEGRNRIEDEEVIAIIRQAASERGTEQRKITAEEVVERCIYALVNEGARILNEGIAQRAGDIDIVYLYGYGFPPQRGGPMFYAGLVGHDKVEAAMARFAERYGEAYWPEVSLG